MGSGSGAGGSYALSGSGVLTASRITPVIGEFGSATVDGTDTVINLSNTFRNPVAFLIPCHRVLRASGEFGEYHWGTMRKTAICGWEAAVQAPPA